MVFILNETQATKIFAKYRNVAAFTLSKGLKGISNNDIEVSYEKLSFLPDEDTINAIKAGDMKLKKVIKDAVKALKRPNMNDDESVAVGLGMTQLVNIITSNRKHKRGPAILVFVYDEEDPARNKIMIKYLTALFEVFGLEPIRKDKVVKKLFKKRKKAKDNVIRFIKNNKGMTLSKKGVELKKLNTYFYEIELRESALSNLTGVRDMGKETMGNCVKTLVKVYTAENLQEIPDKKTCKRLAKKDKKAVAAYKDLRNILRSMDASMKKMPKVEFGQKKKKGKAVGRKMDSKKFIKFFTKKKNRSYLLLVYAHTVAVLLGLDVGTKEYNGHMKGACKIFDNEDFGKEFVAAATTYAKSGDEK